MRLDLGHGQGDAGFTILELLLVVTLIGILASMAMPALGRARTASVEAATVASLRSLMTAQATFATNCGGGYYSPTIAGLRSGTGKLAFIGPEFTTNSTDRQGYRIVFTAGTAAAKAPKTCNNLAAGTVRISFFIGADPLSSGFGQGVRHFGTGPGGIFQSTAKIAVFQTGKPPAPAVPLK